jgi:hypothetical protein
VRSLPMELGPPIQMCDALFRNLSKLPEKLEVIVRHCPAHDARSLILRVAAVGKWTAAYGQGLRLLPVST